MTRRYKLLPNLLLKRFQSNNPRLKFLGFRIPYRLIYLTGGGIENFKEISFHHRSLLQRHLDLQPGDTVLELGCGVGRDAMHLSSIPPFVKEYIGIDIIKDSIDWAQKNITKKHPNFIFHHNDVLDQLHNPGGKLNVSDIRLPVGDKSIDKVFLWSVFTHMSESTIRHYLAEFRRVLKDDGLGFASCFIVNEEVLNSAAKVNLTPYDLKFLHLYDDRCYVNDIEVPMGAVAYTESKVDEMLSRCGMERRSEFFRGGWSGHWSNPIDGQDGFCFGSKR